MNDRSCRILLPAAAALLFAAVPATASAQAAYSACYVPAVGALYLIKLAGLSGACLAAGHTEISWSATGGTLADGSVTTAKLGDGAVTAIKLAAGAVDASKIADNSVTAADLAAGSVGSDELASNAVVANKIATGAVGSTQIADNSITTADLAAGAVGTADLSDAAVTSAKLAPGVIPSFRRTVLNYTTIAEASNPPTTPQQLRVVGTFTKVSAATDIELVWNSHVAGAGDSPIEGCNFHVRVNGTASPPDDLGAVISVGQGLNPVSTTNLFTTLGAGTHTVSIWVRGLGASRCIENPGGYSRRVIVTEYQP
jgi:hypothetical protein